MGKDSLPLVFGPGKLEYQQAQKWYDSILKNKDAYSSCYIPSITRVKNLGSKYMHEYCQFIVEDRSTGERARIYAERMNEKDIDVVTIGRDEQAPRNWDELPLPLTSIAFEDKTKQPTLFDVAKLINSVSVVGGAYKFYDKNCFWFAFTTFDTVRLAFPGTLKNWLWVNPGGKGGGAVADAWGLGFPTMFKYFFKDFEGKRKSDLVWLQPGENRDTITPDDYVQKLSGHLLEDRSVEAYSEWSKNLGLLVTKEDLVEITSKVESNIKDLYEKGDINWSLEFDSAVVDITRKTENDPNASKYLEKYNAQPKSGYVDIDIDDVDVNIGALKAVDAVDGQKVGNPSRDVVFADADKSEELAKALKVLVGAVLVDAKLGN